MKHFLIVSINYKTEIPKPLLDKILELFDSDNEVDLNSDDFVTHFPETDDYKKISLNMHFKSKDFKTAVFDLMVKGHILAKGWEVFGPIKMKKYFFAMTLKTELPKGVDEISIVLNKVLTA
jgi:hypothetical protein